VCAHTMLGDGTRMCVLQCVAVCCSVLQCVAVCCSVRPLRRCLRWDTHMSLVRVAVCCRVFQCVAAWCSVLHRVAACSGMEGCRKVAGRSQEGCRKVAGPPRCPDPSYKSGDGCSTLRDRSLDISRRQFIAVCYSVLQCVVVCCSVL